MRGSLIPNPMLLVKHAAPQIVEALPSAQWSLSEAGKRQCDELLVRLARHRPGALFTSREPKARETASILGSRLGLGASPRDGLHENDRTGLPFFHDSSELDATMRSFFERPAERIVGGETADEARARFAEAVRGVLASTSAPVPIVVAHGTVISLLLAHANRLSAYRLWRELDFTSFAVVSTPSYRLEEIVHPTRS